jgi:hypothetical protein
MKRIHKPAFPTANDAARHSEIMNHSGYVCLFAAIAGSNRREIHRLDDIASARFIEGTLIHNGKCGQAFSVGFLAISLVKPSF